MAVDLYPSLLSGKVEFVFGVDEIGLARFLNVHSGFHRKDLLPVEFIALNK